MTERSAFRYFKAALEIIRLAEMMYERFPLSLRKVADLLHERGVGICYETVRFWWHRFGPLFAAEIRKRRDRKVALKFHRKSMKQYGQPEVIVTDRLRSYGAAMKVIGNADRQETGRWLSNRAENSHLPFRRRERAMLRFRRMRSLQKFASVHASVFNHFNQECSLSGRSIFKQNRTAALDNWRGLCAG